MTMNTMKTLMLAAVTALSLGAGSAMAQESGGPSMPTIDYWAAKQIAAEQATRANQVQSGQVQSGSSDVSTLRPTHFDYSDLANPG
jgi:hypothetical protein